MGRAAKALYRMSPCTSVSVPAKITWNTLQYKNNVELHSFEEKSKNCHMLPLNIRDLKQTDAAVVRRRPTSKPPFKKAQGQVNSVGPRHQLNGDVPVDRLLSAAASVCLSSLLNCDDRTADTCKNCAKW